MSGHCLPNCGHAFGLIDGNDLGDLAASSSDDHLLAEFHLADQVSKCDHTSDPNLFDRADSRNITISGRRGPTPLIVH